MNIAGQVFDIYDDYMLKVAAEHKAELTGASVLDPIEVEKLDDSSFALIMKTANQKR